MKTFIFGIDGLDRDILIRYKNVLPNFSQIIDKSSDIKLMSVYPPDSHTAWASIYTGLNPAQHGLVDFIDPLEKTKILSEGDIDNSMIQGKTFWDFLSNQGKKVCIVFPHLGYPSWKINGVMIGRSSSKESFSVYPESLKDRYDFSNLGLLKGFPNSDELEDYIVSAKKLIREEHRFTTQLMNDFEWDLTFTYSSVLDWIEHYFWNSFEDNDSIYKNIILDFYKEYDRILGLYLGSLENIRSIVLSDHGHGARPKKIVNLNEILRQKGLLKSRIKTDDIYDPFYLYEKIKKYAINFIVRHNLGKGAQRFLVKFPISRKIYTSPISINWNDTTAYISDLSGIKAYSYGGINVIRKDLKKKDYDELLENIISEFMILKNPKTGENLFKWIKKREDLYDGKFIEKYPEIVFDLNEGYGAGWNLFDDLISNAPSSSLVPGSHKIETAVYLSNVPHAKKDMVLTNIYNMILYEIDL